MKCLLIVSSLVLANTVAWGIDWGTFLETEVVGVRPDKVGDLLSLTNNPSMDIRAGAHAFLLAYYNDQLNTEADPSFLLPATQHANLAVTYNATNWAGVFAQSFLITSSFETDVANLQAQEAKLTSFFQTLESSNWEDSQNPIYMHSKYKHRFNKQLFKDIMLESFVELCLRKSDVNKAKTSAALIKDSELKASALKSIDEYR